MKKIPPVLGRFIIVVFVTAILSVAVREHIIYETEKCLNVLEHR